MAITVARTSKLDNVINVDSLHGVTFTNENQGHQFEITCTQGGEEVALTGSISARFLRANQTTVLLTGSIVNGHAVVSLLQDCYNVPGRFQLAVFNTVDSKTTCIYAAVGTVQRTQAGDLIDSGSVVPTLDELLAQIEACKTAENTANAAAANANNAVSYISGVFSDSKVYSTGDYVVYNGKLYRFTKDHAAGDWATSDVVRVAVGDEIGSLRTTINNSEALLSYYLIRHDNIKMEGLNYLFSFKAGRMYRFYNIGTVSVNIFTRIGETNVETIAMNLLPNTCILFTPNTDADYIRVYWRDSDAGGRVIVNYGEAVEDLNALKADRDRIYNILQQDVINIGNIIPYPYTDKDVVRNGVAYNLNGRLIHIEGTTTGNTIFHIYGSWRITGNIKNTNFIPGHRYEIVNRHTYVRIAFFSENGDLLAQINGLARSFVVPIGADGINIFYQITTTGITINEDYLPLIIESETIEDSIAKNYDNIMPKEISMSGDQITEVYENGAKRITDFSGKEIIERMYYDDGATQMATRTTTLAENKMTINATYA